MKVGVAQEYVNHVRAFSRDARLVIVASVILAIGTAAPQIFAALYFRALGFDATIIGWVSTINQIGGALGTLPAMLVLGRMGRRAGILVGAAGSLLTWGAAMLTPTPAVILFWLAVSGMFNVLLGLAIVPVLAEASDVYERTTLFAVRDALVWLTLAAASVLTGFLPALLAPLLVVGAESAEVYRAVLLGSVLMRLLALVPLAMLRLRAREDTSDKSDAAVVRSSETASRDSYLRYLNPRMWFKLDTPLFKIGLPFVIVYFAGSLVLPFLPLFLKDQHAATDGLIGAMQGLSYLSIGVGTLLAPMLVRLIGRRALIVGAALVAAVCVLAMGFVPSRDAVIAITVLRAGLFNMVLPVYRALVIDAAPRREHTITAFTLALAENIGATPAPRLSGGLQKAFGYGPVFVLSALLYGAGAVVFAWAAKAPETPRKSTS